MTVRANEMCTAMKRQRSLPLGNVSAQEVRVLIRTAIKLLEDVFFIQRRAAAKLLTIRLNDSSMVG